MSHVWQGVVLIGSPVLVFVLILLAIRYEDAFRRAYYGFIAYCVGVVICCMVAGGLSLIFS